MKIKKNVAIYIRVSTDEQAEEGHSLKNQLSQAREVAKKLNNKRIKEYIDDGYSARTINRPALKRLINDIKLNNIEHLIINDLDRFIRNVVDCENLINLCLEHDVKLHGVYFNPKINNADDRLIIRFKSAIAQHGSEKISENTIKGIRGGLLKGIYTISKAPFGYTRKSDGKLKVVEEDFFFVKLIFSLYINEDISIKDINEHVKNTFDINISQSKIARILRSDKYTTSFDYRGEKFLSNDFGLEEVVPQDIFSNIQDKLDRHCKKIKYEYFFKDKLVCSFCNNILIAKPTKKRMEKFIFIMNVNALAANVIIKG